MYFSHSQNKFTTHGVLANQHTVFTEWRHPLTADIHRHDAVTKLYESGISPWCTAFHDFATVCKHRWESGLASTFFSKKIDQMVRFLWSFQIVIWHAVFCIIWWFCRFACQTKRCPSSPNVHIQYLICISVIKRQISRALLDIPKGGPCCIFCEYSEYVSREPQNYSLSHKFYV